MQLTRCGPLGRVGSQHFAAQCLDNLIRALAAETQRGANLFSALIDPVEV
jgi:hypothetical protein